jgi:hypothetical protein
VFWSFATFPRSYELSLNNDFLLTEQMCTAIKLITLIYEVFVSKLVPDTCYAEVFTIFLSLSGICRDSNFFLVYYSLITLTLDTILFNILGGSLNKIDYFAFCFDEKN